MKVTEVPQDQDPSFEGSKKLCYALDSEGHFVQVKTSGWNVEATAKDLAWNAIHRELNQTKNRVQSGLASPLEYFMKKSQMNVNLLAQNMNISRWRVWWHLKPHNFIKLKPLLIDRYAETLNVSKEILLNYRGE
jgi:hypothetical protein